MEIREQEHKTSIYIRGPKHSVISMLLYCILIRFPKLACSQSLNIDSVSAFFNISLMSLKFQYIMAVIIFFKI